MFVLRIISLGVFISLYRGVDGIILQKKTLGLMSISAYRELYNFESINKNHSKL